MSAFHPERTLNRHRQRRQATHREAAEAAASVGLAVILLPRNSSSASLSNSSAARNKTVASGFPTQAKARRRQIAASSRCRRI